MELTKSPPELVARFGELVPAASGVERRQMFGYPSATFGGRMFMSLFADRMVLRLADDDAEALRATHGCDAFEPMPGRPMTGFVLLPKQLVVDTAAVRPWVDRALAWATAQPPKVKKGKAKA